MPMRPVMRPPVLNEIQRGSAFAKSFAGDTTLAAMFTASVAITTENIAKPTTSGLVKWPTSLTGSQMGSPYRIALALVISTPMAANRNIVVGSATLRPTTCSFWLRPKRVKSGMLSDSVAQNPIIAVSEGQNTGRNVCAELSVPGCASNGPKPFAAVTAQTSSKAVTTSTYGAAQFSTQR